MAATVAASSAAVAKVMGVEEEAPVIVSLAKGIAVAAPLTVVQAMEVDTGLEMARVEEATGTTETASAVTMAHTQSQAEAPTRAGPRKLPPCVRPSPR